MVCELFSYLDSGLTTHMLTASGQITNPGTGGCGPDHHDQGHRGVDADDQRHRLSRPVTGRADHLGLGPARRTRRGSVGVHKNYGAGMGWYGQMVNGGCVVVSRHRKPTFIVDCIGKTKLTCADMRVAVFGFQSWGIGRCLRSSMMVMKWFW